MTRALFIAFGVLMTFGHLHAQDSSQDQDTIFLQRSDSVFYFDHIIHAGQTLYGLSQLYQTPLASIHRLNPRLMETELAIGDTINIPLNTTLILDEDEVNVKHRAVAIYHVQPRETLYTIARRWAKKKVAYIKRINNMENSDLALNRSLKLGWMDIRMLKDPDFDTEEIEIVKLDNELASKIDTSNTNTSIIEQGKAIWNKSKTGADQPFILHRKAKLNSIVQLYNPMTGKKIHAKVVGRMSSRNYDDNVLVVLTPYLAKALKARDQAFFVKMKYIM